MPRGNDTERQKRNIASRLLRPADRRILGPSRMAAEASLRRDALANRQAVIDAAAQVLRSRPNATMAEIAARAGLGRTTVYRHFAGRDELLRALVAHVADEVDERSAGIVAREESVEETLRAIAGACIEVGLRYPFLYGLRQDAVPALRRLTGTATTPYLDYLVAARERGELRSDQPLRWITAVQAGVTIAMIGELLAGRFERAEAAGVLGDTLVAMTVAR